MGLLGRKKESRPFWRKSPFWEKVALLGESPHFGRKSPCHWGSPLAAVNGRATFSQKGRLSTSWATFSKTWRDGFVDEKKFDSSVLGLPAPACMMQPPQHNATWNLVYLTALLLLQKPSVSSMALCVKSMGLLGGRRKRSQRSAKARIAASEWFSFMEV